MDENPAPAAIPQWNLADRMQKARHHAGLSVQELADYLGVSRNTVSTWINGRIKPSTQTLRLWAIKCGVSYDWLRVSPSAAAPHPEGQNSTELTPLPAPSFRLAA